MKLFKNLMIVLSVSLLLWGCSDDDESINNGNSTISLSTNILQVDKNGGDATVTVTSSDNWRLSGICDWAHPSITSGKDGDVVLQAHKAGADDLQAAAVIFKKAVVDGGCQRDQLEYREDDKERRNEDVAPFRVAD